MAAFRSHRAVRCSLLPLQWPNSLQRNTKPLSQDELLHCRRTVQWHCVFRSDFKDYQGATSVLYCSINNCAPNSICSNSLDPQDPSKRNLHTISRELGQNELHTCDTSDESNFSQPRQEKSKKNQNNSAL